MYLVKTPRWLKSLFSNYVWHISAAQKVLYLTFDDGPHPVATPFVLDELKKHEAKATFFCIGKNVLENDAVYQRIIAEGHTVANHTNNHLNGWKTTDEIYLDNIYEASKHINSPLFRPPYGRIKKNQGRTLLAKGFKIVMWDVLSGDFDINLSPQNCLNNVAGKSVPGSIIVFHDSEKAFKNMSYALPRVLNFFIEKGFRFEALNGLSFKKGGPE